jgi:xanthine dehydrogenase YagT iron-sulfur-binding subunit
MIADMTSDERAIPEPVTMVRLQVNGEPRELPVDSRTTLLDALRENMRLTGTKKGCDHGQCGACTVLVGGRRMNSCLLLAVMLADAEITTVEGLAGAGGTLHPVQQAFIDHDALQCGYCTPGQVCSAVAMLDEAAARWPSAATADLAGSGVTGRDLAGRAALDAAEIRERMSGNLCRCGAYVNIVAAILAAAEATRVPQGPQGVSEHVR